jgi:hypothetical protein
MGAAASMCAAAMFVSQRWMTFLKTRLQLLFYMNLGSSTCMSMAIHLSKLHYLYEFFIPEYFQPLHYKLDDDLYRKTSSIESQPPLKDSFHWKMT